MTKSKGIGRGNNPNSHIGHKNLIPFGEMPPERAKEITRKGQAACVKKIKEQKEAKKVMEVYDKIDLSNTELVPQNIKDYCREHNILCTSRAAMDVAMILGSLNGGKDGIPNPACYKIYMDYNVGMPTQKVEQTLQIRPLSNMDTVELEQYIRCHNDRGKKDDR